MTGGVDVDWVMFCYVTQECSAEEITDQKTQKQASWTAKNTSFNIYCESLNI